MPGTGSGRADSRAGSVRSIAADFARFQGDYPLHRVFQPRTELEWAYYQAGPAAEADPIVCFHGTSGTAAAFFYQVRALAEKGYRVFSVQYPAYDTPEDWCKGCDLFFDAVKCRSAHIVGAGLGGFLAQHLAGRFPHRVKSLVLCNAFATTHAFAEKAGPLQSVLCFMPTPVLRQMMLDSFPDCGMEFVAKQAIDWVAQQVHGLNGNDLASRLQLSCTPSNVPQIGLEQKRITMLESSGETMVPEHLRRQLRALYPEARLAQLKASGDFPYLSRPEEATLFLEVHMRSLGVFAGSTGSAGSAASAVSAAPPWVSSGVASFSPTAEGRKGREGPEGREGREGREARLRPQESREWEPGEPDPGPERPAPRRPVWVNPFEDDLL